MNPSERYQLIGTEFSYYTGKVRSYLRYKRIPFEEVLSTPQVYKEIIIPKTGVRYIPVLVTSDGTAIQDTTEIIDFLEKRHPFPSVYPNSPSQKLCSLLFEIYGDEWLVLPAMMYRWKPKENYEFIIQEFGSLAPHLSANEQFERGKIISKQFSSSLPFLGISDNNYNAIEEWYFSFLDQLNKHFEKHLFLLGPRPSIGDFGLMGPLYAHLGRDPYPKRIMIERAPLVYDWIERMNLFNDHSTFFLQDDDVPTTLLPIMQRMFDEHFPIYFGTVKALKEWQEKNPSSHILPRTIGSHEFTIGGVTETRKIYPYTLWMFQRAIDFYASLSEPQKQKLFVNKIRNGREILDKAVKLSQTCRVSRKENQVIITSTPSKF